MTVNTGEGGGGSGGGFTLGPEQNEFTSVAQRDTYTTTNPTWAAAYAANPTLLIQVTVGGTATFYRRVGTAWQDVTNIIRQRGAKGDKGDPGETFPSAQAKDEVLVATSASDEDWRLLVAANLDAALIARLLPEGANDAQIVSWNANSNTWQLDDFPEDSVTVNSPLAGTGTAASPLSITTSALVTALEGLPEAQRLDISSGTSGNLPFGRVTGEPS